MKASLISLRYQESSSSQKQGVKGGRVPYGAVRGGYGTYIVANPSKLILRVGTENGEIISKNIAYEAKIANGWDRLTKKRAQKLEKELANRQFSITDGQIDDLENILNIEY